MGRRIFSSIAALATASMPSAVSASAVAPAPPRVPVAAPPFVEFLPKTRPATVEPFVAVSGDAGAPRARLRAPILTVSGIDEADRTLCVDIRSADGGYVAYFKVPNPHRGAVVAFELPSRTIASYGARALEIPARVRASRDVACSSADPLLASSWTGGSAIGGLVFKTQSTQNSTLIDGARAAGCAAMRDVVDAPLGRMTSLDTFCPLSAPPRCGAEAVVVLQSRTGSDYGPSLSLRVRGACPRSRR